MGIITTSTSKISEEEVGTKLALHACYVPLAFYIVVLIIPALAQVCHLSPTYTVNGCVQMAGIWNQARRVRNSLNQDKSNEEIPLHLHVSSSPLHPLTAQARTAGVIPESYSHPPLLARSPAYPQIRSPLFSASHLSLSLQPPRHYGNGLH